MFIKKLSVDGFKNLKNINIDLNPKLNILCGENAQGKTNLIEAIWLCSGAKSFRNTKEKDYVSIYEDLAKIDLSFQDKIREQNISFKIFSQNHIIREKSILLNGVKLKTQPKLFGNLRCVIFTPEDLELSKGSPENRRSFIDHCISQIKPSYNSVISKYENVLVQRNTLLKNSFCGNLRTDDIAIWDEQLSKLGAYITTLRYNYVKKLEIYAKALYENISNGKENLEITYSSTVFEDLSSLNDYDNSLSEFYLKKLSGNLIEDQRFGFTQIGVHRDDIITKINSLPSRDFGSQGQNRSIALIMKLAQAYILLDETGDAPIILLDDVLSELDIKRQSFILNSIKDMQIFITCCDSEGILKNYQGNRYFIKDGKII